MDGPKAVDDSITQQPPLPEEEVRGASPNPETAAPESVKAPEAHGSPSSVPASLPSTETEDADFLAQLAVGFRPRGKVNHTATAGGTKTAKPTR